MNQLTYYLAAVLFIACVTDFFVISKWKIYKSRRKEQEDLHSNNELLFKQVFYDETVTYLKDTLTVKITKKINPSTILEVCILALWAIYIGWDYLNMDPYRIPAGREIGSAISSNHLWTQFIKCGWCAAWNGFQRGGFPAFADIQGSMLHPTVILTTLLFGVVNGVKVNLVISFWLAGIAQWWIARELNLSWIPRIWSACLAIAGGHLTSRMQLGVPGVVLATATTSLVFAALIRLARSNTRQNAVLLGICTAGAIVSGQGYIQVGLIAILPVYLLFFWKKDDIHLTWNNYFIAALVAFLLSAPFLVPFLHFSPNIVKDFDPEFKAAQPLSYFILNLVIDDWRYYNSNIMSKYPYPYLYSLYIGWVPVLLFIYSLSTASLRYKKIFWFMVAGIITEFLVGSAVVLKLLVHLWPTVAGVRHSPQIAGLAIPLILGLSAFGLEKLLLVQWSLPGTFFSSISSKWLLVNKLLLVVPLIFSLQSCAHFALYWIGTSYQTKDMFLTLEKLKTEDLQWVNPPFGQHQYIEAAIGMNLKLSPGILTWNWRNRLRPEMYIEAEYLPKADTPSGIIFKTHTENQYAYIETVHGNLPCYATGSGGYIEVQCNGGVPGILHVQENMWTGWYAWVDGIKVDLVEDQRLAVNAPVGSHSYVFRYLPWDVAAGLIMFILGIFFSFWIWTSQKNFLIGK